MDSKTVNREVKRLIWPALKEQGFDHFTSRVAWRHQNDTIDVLEFQSFNRYNADILGITTFSFAVNLGKFLLYIPPTWPPKVKNGIQLPSEAECLFRGSLLPGVSPATASKNVWSVDSGGKNLHWCIRDVHGQLPCAFAWFRRLEEREEVLRVLLQENEDMHTLWGFGRNPSPVRSYSAGYVALALGDEATATSKLREAVDSKCFVQLFNSLDGAFSRAV